MFDRDLDNAPRQAAGPGDSWEHAAFPERYCRLVANPFLAGFGLVAWAGLMQGFVRAGMVHVVLLSTPFALILPRLLQYHCLDCGATGRLGSWKEHDCPAIRLRKGLGRPRRFRGPTPPAQTIAWAIVSASALLSYLSDG